MNTQFAALSPVGDGALVLQAVRVEAQLRDALSEVSVHQCYQNPGEHNIEAVYTFPLPLDAVLLELEVAIGERRLHGVVVASKEASERYEEAITDGDGAVMLQEASPGLYTMNVGNLGAGAQCAISFTYAQLNHWQGNALRFLLPTTIAPRYGNAARAGLEPHQVPAVAIGGGTGLSIAVSLHGQLAKADVHCPTHGVTVEVIDSDTTGVRLRQASVSMDRDFVLQLALPAERHTSARADYDHDGYIVHACFHPELGLTEDEQPRSFKILLDCSGSMAGDSIAQAREALTRMVYSLRPQDQFNIVRFGSGYEALFSGQQPADRHHRELALHLARGLQADLGGTEIGAALVAAFALDPEPDVHDVLLITDGEIWDGAPVIADSRRARHRIFTVGVGSAVAEAFVRDLATQTGGACELVTPREDMAERIHRHFLRMLAPRFNKVATRWPAGVAPYSPDERRPVVFDGDTLHLFAHSPQPPDGQAVLTLELPDGEALEIVALIDPVPFAQQASELGSALARVAAALRLRELQDPVAGGELAVRYQLVSPWTHYLVIDERASQERETELPELHRVANRLAAGWGGVSSLDSDENVLYMQREPLLSPSSMSGGSGSGDMSHDHVWNMVMDDDTPTGFEPVSDADRFTEELHALRATLSAPYSGPLIQLSDLPLRVADALNLLVNAAHLEAQVVTGFLRLFVISIHSVGLPRSNTRFIRMGFKQNGADLVLLEAIVIALSDLEGWKELVEEGIIEYKKNGDDSVRAQSNGQSLEII